MEVYSIGFTQKTAEEFFGTLKKAGVRRLLDIRLNNVSQLAGFTKRDDLRYFLREICDADYVHELLLAPTQEIMDDFKKREGTWQKFEKKFRALMSQREIEKKLKRSSFATPTVLLCSEAKPDHCHRRLVLEHLALKWGNLTIRHL
jgi:uncharacterized protein (DUF488 family)